MRASSSSIIGMPSRTGYARRSARHTSCCGIGMPREGSLADGTGEDVEQLAIQGVLQRRSARRARGPERSGRRRPSARVPTASSTNHQSAPANDRHFTASFSVIRTVAVAGNGNAVRIERGVVGERVRLRRSGRPRAARRKTPPGFPMPATACSARPWNESSARRSPERRLTASPRLRRAVTRQRASHPRRRRCQARHAACSRPSVHSRAAPVARAAARPAAAGRCRGRAPRPPPQSRSPARAAGAAARRRRRRPRHPRHGPVRGGHAIRADDDHVRSAAARAAPPRRPPRPDRSRPSLPAARRDARPP